jgi:iron complex transport system substrate-binding protein
MRAGSSEAVPEELPVKEMSASYMLIVVASGSAEAYIEGRACKLNPDSVVFLNPRACLEIHRVCRSRLKWHAIAFEIWKVAEEDSDGRQTLVKETSDYKETGQIETRFSRTISASAAQLVKAWRHAGVNEGMSFQADSLFMNVLHQLESNPSNGDEYDSERRIREAVAYIRDNYREDITRELLSHRCGLTPEYFSSVFRKVTGCTFADYLARVRIAKAKEQLLVSKSTLNQIAHTVGYADGLYLSRKFKQMVGLSPTAYIKKPKKIVCLQYLGHILALGLTPAGTTAKQLSPFALSPTISGIRDVGIPVSLPKIAGLEPDLILTIREQHEHLSQIATTIAIPWGRLDTLRELEYIGELLDRRNEAEAWIAGFCEKEERARREVAGIVGKRESVADHMFVTVYAADGGDKRAADIMNSELWKNLPAVKNNRVYKLDIDQFAAGDLISLEKQLDIQVQMLLPQNKK